MKNVTLKVGDEQDFFRRGKVLARWADAGQPMLLKRVFDIEMQRCPNCGAGELKIIAAIQERAVIRKILAHLGLDPQPPTKGRVREAELHFVA